MKSELSIAIEKVSTAKSKRMIRFYWLIILHHFTGKGNKKDIVQELWSYGPMYTEPYWEVLRKMPEFTFSIAEYFQRHMSSREKDPIASQWLLNRKFKALTLEEQLKAIDSLVAENKDKPLWLTVDLLAKAKFTGAARHVAKHLKKCEMCVLATEKLKAFIAVAKSLQFETS